MDINAQLIISKLIVIAISTTYYKHKVIGTTVEVYYASHPLPHQRSVLAISILVVSVSELSSPYCLSWTFRHLDKTSNLMKVSKGRYVGSSRRRRRGRNVSVVEWTVSDLKKNAVVNPITADVPLGNSRSLFVYYGWVLYV